MGCYQRMHVAGMFGSVSDNYRRAYAERYSTEWRGMDYKLAEILDNEPVAPTSGLQETWNLEAMKEYQDRTFPPSHPCWHGDDGDLSDVMDDEWWQK